MSKLFLMMGAPGSGKSYFAKKVIKPGIDAYISRDEVRFSMLKDEDDYFAKEGQVFDEFARQISRALVNHENVFADATHLNAGSRLKILNKLSVQPSEVNVIYLKTPLDICLKRNSERTGRKYVPESSIRNMFHSIRLPEAEEGIHAIYIVEQDKPIEIRVLEGGNYG